MPKINVIIADDHPIFRFGLANIIKSSKELNLIAEAENGAIALELILQHKPDVAVLDIEMPFLNGLQVCEEIKKIGNNTIKILFLTLFKEADLYKKAIDLGAAGYLLKDNAAEELVEAIIKVNNGEKFISNGIESKLVKRKSNILIDPKLKEAILNLTSTETNILVLIAEHKTSKEIAALLFISEKTVENHRYNISKKLALESTKNNLLVFALEHRCMLDNL